MSRCRLLAPFALVALLASCGSAAAPQSAAPKSAAGSGAAQTRMIASYSSIAPTVNMTGVTKDAGLLDKHGLDVDLQYIARATTVPALISGQAHLAAVGG